MLQPFHAQIPNVDIKNLKTTDVFKEKRTLDRIKAGEELSKKTQGNIPIIGWIEGPLAEACDLAGVENMMIQLMMDPDFANRLMDKCMITAKDFAKAQIQAGCEVIGMDDAVCSQITGRRSDSFWQYQSGLVKESSRNKVFEMSKKLVEKYQNERYLLSAGCEITSLTPPENLLAMREASLF